MKFAFSTLGCPGWSWEDMIVTAKDLGFNGIEVRGIENELYVPRTKPFSPENIDNTKARISKMGLEIPCLTSACLLFHKSGADSYTDEGKHYIDLAHSLGTPFVRVLGDRNPEPGNDIDSELVAENLSVLAAYAKENNVGVLIETNGVYARSEDILQVVEKAGGTNVGILWDLHHPFRYMNETVSHTYHTLKEYIRYIHIKDSVWDNGKVKYKMMGYGDVPVKDALVMLKEEGFKGYVSLEWVKRWCMDLEDPGVVFSHFINVE